MKGMKKAIWNLSKSYSLSAIKRVEFIIVLLIALVACTACSKKAADAPENEISTEAESSTISLEEIEESIAAASRAAEEQRIAESELAEQRRIATSKEAAEKAAKNLEDAAKIDSKINAIGTVTVMSGTKIEEARKAYNQATQNVKNAVKNLSKLSSAEQQYRTILQNQGKSALDSAFTSKYDMVEDITWYSLKIKPQYINERSYVLPYIGVRGKSVWMVLEYNYFGSEWVFWKSVIFVVDGTRYNKSSYKYYSIDHDTAWNGVIENYHDTDLSDKDIEMLYKIGNSNSAVVRFSGDSRSNDLTISKQDKQAISNAVLAYLYLKNKNQ